MEIKIAPAPTGIETTQELNNTNATMTVASKELGLYATEPSGIFDATSILARLDALETA